MASLCKKCRCGRGAWGTCSHVWLIRRREGGREVYTNVGADRAGAERALRRLEATPAETVAQALGAWYATKEADPEARPNSLAGYRTRIAKVKAAFGEVLVASLRPEHLSRFVSDLLAAGYAPATVQGYYHCLTAALRHAKRRGVIRTLPIPDETGIPQPAEREHELTLAQVDQIIGRMTGLWRDVAEVVYLTGARWGEAVAIDPEDVGANVVRLFTTANRHGGTNRPKTKRGHRVVPLSARAKALLSEMSLPVVAAYGGDTAKAYKDAYAALVAAMGDLHRKGMGWHSLRAAHATLLDAAGVSLREAAARMGHGHAFAQTLAYRVAVEVERADTGALDRARQRHASSGSPSVRAGGKRSARRRRARSR